MISLGNRGGWRIARKGDLPQIVDLICQEEWLCMGLSSLIYNKGNIDLPVNRGKTFIFSEEGTLSGVLFYSNEGLLYVYLSRFFYSGNIDVKIKMNQLTPFISLLRPLPFFIAGSSKAVELIESCFPDYPAKEKCLYFCMKRIGMKEYHPPLPEGFKLYRAGKDDFNKLFPLEIAYQKEEVIRKGRINIGLLKRRFRDQLRDEMIFFLEKEGVAVAKAGTNAKGFTHRQFGGVYTRPEERNRGLSTFLTATLVEKVMEEMLGATLFVKKENKSAIKVYEKCRFHSVGDFQIDYFR